MNQADRESKRPTVWRGCMMAFVVAVVSVCFLLGIVRPRLIERAKVANEMRLAQDRQEWIDWVKAGRTMVNVDDVRLISALANDEECVNRVEGLCFWTSTVITQKEAKDVSKFKNLKYLGFYCCPGDSADSVLAHAHNLPIEELFFELTDLSNEKMRDLASYPKLTKVHFEQGMAADKIAILEQLPQTIDVKLPHSTAIPNDSTMSDESNAN